MIATARIHFDRDYFALQYDDWLKHRSRFKKYEIWLALLLLAFGVGLAISARRQWMVGGLFACAGVYEVVMSATSKLRWLRARLSTVSKDKTIHLEFHESELKSASNAGTGTMRLDSFIEFTLATNGFFLVPDTGVSIYVPRASIDPIEAYDSLNAHLKLTIRKAIAQRRREANAV